MGVLRFWVHIPSADAVGRYTLSMEVILMIGLAGLGAILASFIGVLAERVNTGASFVTGRSHCNSCNRQLSALDLVPVFSWTVSGGRCRTCKARIPYLYTVSEATLALLFVLAYMKFGLSPLLALFLAAVLVLAFIVFYDLRHTIVPPLASGLLSVIAVAFALVAYGEGQLLGAVFLSAGIIASGFLLLFLLSRGRAMGLGDSPVALSLSLIAGPAAFAGLLFSFWIGAIIGICILVSRPKGHRMGIEVPFVPFLAVGYLLAFFTQWNPLTLGF